MDLGSDLRIEYQLTAEEAASELKMLVLALSFYILARSLSAILRLWGNELGFEKDASDPISSGVPEDFVTLYGAHHLLWPLRGLDTKFSKGGNLLRYSADVD